MRPLRLPLKGASLNRGTFNTVRTSEKATPVSKEQRFRDAYSKLRMLARGVATEKGGALINAWVKSAATLLVDSEGVISSQEYAEIASVMVKAPQKCGYVHCSNMDVVGG